MVLNDKEFIAGLVNTITFLKIFGDDRYEWLESLKKKEAPEEEIKIAQDFLNKIAACLGVCELHYDVFPPSCKNNIN